MAITETDLQGDVRTCPICNERIEESLKVHIQNSHSEDDVERAVLADKEKGMPDVTIGDRYGISFRQLERMITRQTGTNISQVGRNKEIKKFGPKDFVEEKTTVWSFKSRGNWATHSGEYRGNWSPYIPRNVILKYSAEGDTVLDYFCGGGTTAVEAKLLGRKFIGLDINDAAIELAIANSEFEIDSERVKRDHAFVADQIFEPLFGVSDARMLEGIKDESIDLICAHPPYANIVSYTHDTKSDLSNLEVPEFLEQMKSVAKESYRVLKPGHQCAILIGDTRQKKHVVPMGFGTIQAFLDAGFVLKELIIKRQHNCKTTGFWRDNSIKYNFLLLAHEYLPIFEKPLSGDLREDTVNMHTQNTPRELGRKSVEIEDFETTTVWIFDEDKIDQSIKKNVDNRYANQVSKEGLLFVRTSPSGNDSSPFLNADAMIKKTVEEVEVGIQKIKTGGYCVVQTQDARIGEYIKPIAVALHSKLKELPLAIKEIIVAAPKICGNEDNLSAHLTIAHQYLLVYVYTG
ncbi:MAG: site-specific DNA-methyltransferase [Candidatus Paceibacterota bacterium]